MKRYPNRVRLEVECLEKREVLSTTNLISAPLASAQPAVYANVGTGATTLSYGGLGYGSGTNFYVAYKDAGFPSNGQEFKVQIGNEVLTVAVLSAYDPSGLTWRTVARGLDGTTESLHYGGTQVTLIGQAAAQLQATLDFFPNNPGQDVTADGTGLILEPGAMSKSAIINVSGWRNNTADPVEVLVLGPSGGRIISTPFQLPNNLPNGLNVFPAEGNVANVVSSELVFNFTDGQDGIHHISIAFSAVQSAPPLTTAIELVVRQAGAGEVVLPLNLVVQPSFGSSSNASYVAAAYQDVLGRPADPAGLSYWTAQLGAGLPRAAFANALTHSAEYFTDFVTAAYAFYLGRTPDAGGLAAWVAAMQAGLTDEQLEAGFIGSAEYIANHGGAGAGWVEGMYQDLLGRTPAQPEVDGWVQALADGMATTQVAYGFAASAERETNRVTADYQVFLGRTPDAGGLAAWVNGFVSGGLRNEDVVAGFVASDEYFSRHSS